MTMYTNTNEKKLIETTYCMLYWNTLPINMKVYKHDEVPINKYLFFYNIICF